MTPTTPTGCKKILQSFIGEQHQMRKKKHKQINNSTTAQKNNQIADILTLKNFHTISTPIKTSKGKTVYQRNELLLNMGEIVESRILPYTRYNSSPKWNLPDERLLISTNNNNALILNNNLVLVNFFYPSHILADEQCGKKNKSILLQLKKLINPSHDYT